MSRRIRLWLVTLAALVAVLPASAALFMHGGPGPLPVSTNQTLWINGSNFYKNAGTTLAVDGDLIQQATDISGSGNNVLQNTSGNRPTFKANIIGGRGVMRCDGSSSFMTGPNIFPTSPTPYTLTIVSVQRGTSAGNLVSGATGHALFYNSTNFVTAFDSVTQLASTTATGVGTTAFIVLGDVGRTNSTGNTEAYNFTVNGNYDTGIGSIAVNSDAALQLCAFAAANFNNGDIAEVVLNTKVLSLTEMNRNINYLNSRYAAGLSLYPTDKQCLFDGDSQTAGFKGTPPFALLVAQHCNRFSVNLGSQGIQFSELVSQGASVVDPLYIAGTKNILVLLSTNNGVVLGGQTGAAEYARFQTYCADRHTKGFKLVAAPMLPRGSGSEQTQINAFNTLLASDTCADALVATSCSAIWTPGDNTNLTDYDADQIHLNTTGHGKAATCINAAVDTL